MFRYEMLILASPEITKDEESNLEKQIDTLIRDAKGSIVEFDRWGKYRLAYPVRGHDYGVYFLMRFEVEDKNILKEIDRMFYVKFNAAVMRSMNTKLDLDQSLEYKRPPSLEDTPKKPLTFFQDKELKPKKMSTVSDKKEDVVEIEELEIKESVPAEDTVAEDSAKKNTQSLQAEEVKVELSEEAEAANQPEKQEV